MVYLMLSILKRFYSSSTLYCRFARKLAAFIHENPEKCLSHRKLYKIFRLYEKWRMFVESCRSEPFERDVLYYIAKRVCWSELRDVDFIAKLLFHIYRIDSNLRFIIFPEEELQQSDAHCQTNRVHFAEFFINQANKKHFIIGIHRIVELPLYCQAVYKHPCEAAVMGRCPALLRLYLRYGALTVGESMPVKGIPPKRVSTTIFEIGMDIINDANRMSYVASKKKKSLLSNNEYANLVTCGILIMRVSPQFDKRAVCTRINTFSYQSEEQALFCLAQDAIPEICNHIFLPMTLKHICRLKIRHALHVNWQLPDGIQVLAIPQTLKRYLDLYSD